MNGYALPGEPELPRLLAELLDAAHSTDLTGVRHAIAGLRAVPGDEVGATVAMCWVVVCDQLDGDLGAIDLQRRLLAEELYTSAEFLHAIRAWAAHRGRERGILHPELFDFVCADPAWAGALAGVTRPSREGEGCNSPGR